MIDTALPKTSYLTFEILLERMAGRGESLSEPNSTALRYCCQGYFSVLRDLHGISRFQQPFCFEGMIVM